MWDQSIIGATGITAEVFRLYALDSVRLEGFRPLTFYSMIFVPDIRFTLYRYRFLVSEFLNYALFCSCEEYKYKYLFNNIFRYCLTYRTQKIAADRRLCTAAVEELLVKFVVWQKLDADFISPISRELPGNFFRGPQLYQAIITIGVKNGATAVQ